MSWVARADLVVVGSGVAGLSAALEAHRAGLRVLVVTKDEPDAGSTRWAQGGVAVVLGDTVAEAAGDSVDAHLADTVDAGGGLVDAVAAREVLAAGPAAVRALQADGARFDIDRPCDRCGATYRRAPPPVQGKRCRTACSGAEARTREGGHSRTRIVHAGGDATGVEVERALLAAGGDAELTVLAGHTAVMVLRDGADTDGAVTGLSLLDAHGRPGVVAAPAVLLATGGVGALYESTTNPDVATADGWALALRAGARVADAEFVQFHPTALHVGRGARGRAPLVTEALRGEGARLVDHTGRSVTGGADPRGDLAPRDVVAAAITRRLAELGTDHVLLDATGVADVTTHFPTVTAACRAIGVDPSRDPIPVRPAAHYSCGGVVTDTRGRTGVPGLWAAGEVARTGLHGANRLASNSLLEGLVVGRRAGAEVARTLSTPRRLVDPVVAPAGFVPAADRDVLQAAMTRGAGIGRDAAGLAAASDAIEAATTARRCADRVTVEDAALTLAAQVLLAAAGARTETRGCHVRADHPGTDDRWQRASSVFRLDRDGVVRLDPEPLGGAA